MKCVEIITEMEIWTFEKYDINVEQYIEDVSSGEGSLFYVAF